MPPPVAGNRVPVRYEGFAPYHERIILGHMRGSLFFISTPEEDVYSEDYNITNEDIDSVRVMINEQVAADLLGEEIIEGEGEPVLIEFVPADEYESWESFKASLDSRALQVKTTGSKRPRDWADMLKDSAEARMTERPLKGPRSAQWCVEFLAKQARGAIYHHNFWGRTAGLGAQDFEVQEDEQILEVIKGDASSDQLDVCSLVASEILFRRAQTIEFANAERVRDRVLHQGPGGGTKRSGALTLEEQEAFAGTASSSYVVVAPEPRDSVKSDFAESSELMKSLVKARELREQLGKHKK